MSVWKLIASFLLPVVFYTMIDLSGYVYYSNFKADTAKILTSAGLLGIVLIQTYGAWMIFDHFENKNRGI